MGEEPCCPNCGIPLKAIIAISDDGKCLDDEACRARRDIALGRHTYTLAGGAVTLTPGLWLVSPEGVMKLEPHRLGD